MSAKEEFEKTLEKFITSDKVNKGFVVIGRSGIGKTTIVLEMLKKLKLKHEILRGHVTALQLYKTLYNFRKNIVVLDDVDVFDKSLKEYMLIACLDRYGKVNWLSTRNIEDVPNSFKFEGKVIMITNDKIETKKLEDRCIIYHYKPNINEILSEIEKSDPEIAKLMKENFVDINFRRYERLKIYGMNKNIKDLNGEKDKILKLVMEICSKYSERKEQIAEFIKLTGKSRRTFFNYLRLIKEIGI